MKKFVICTAMMITSFVNAQVIGVPYRIGDKFGLSDENGKMIIPAKYDIVEPVSYNGTKYFTAYTISENTVLSTLIYNNKVVLSDQLYKDYYIQEGIIQASQYKVLKESLYHSDKNFSTTEHLYDITGKRLLQGDYDDIYIIEGPREAQKLKTFLIYSKDKNGKVSIYLYDRNLKKISKTVVDSATDFHINYDYDEDYSKKTITLTYSNKAGAGKKMVLKFENNTITVASEQDINLKAERQLKEEWDPFRMAGDLAIDSQPEAPINSVEEKIILSARKAWIERDFYYLPKKIEGIQIVDHNLKKDEQYIVSRNGKQGLFGVYNKKYIVPVAFDEIIFAEFSGIGGGCILRNGKKYGASIYEHPDNKIIEPVFDMIPILIDYNYFAEKSPLFKLYGDNGKPFCYADGSGKLFYRAK